MKTAWYDSRGNSLRLKVAQAAESSRPNAALRLYGAQVADLIAQRERRHYATAARQLLHMRDVCGRLNQPDVWQSYLDGLRKQHRALRALRNELDKAGL